MTTVITVLHVLVCVFLILVVLLQAGKGGGMGIAFGGAGGGGSVFGGSGAGNFLTRLTVAAAFGFMITSMSLAYLASNTEVDSLQQLSAESRKAAEDLANEKAQIMEAGEGAAGAAVPATDGANETSSEPTEGAAPAAPDTPAEGEPVGAEVPSVETAAPADEAAAPTDEAAAPADEAAAPADDAPATE